MNRSATQDKVELRHMEDGPYRLNLISVRLRQIREDRQLSQYWFANRAGIREKTYWQYEAGNIHPPVQKLIALANTHKFDLNELLNKDWEVRDHELPGELYE